MTPTPLITRRTHRANPSTYPPLTPSFPFPLATREPTGSTAAALLVAPSATPLALPSNTESDSDYTDGPLQSPTLPPVPLSRHSCIMDSTLLAEVRTSKMKDCPILTAGKITPIVLQSWSLAWKRYKKHVSKTDTEIVSFMAEAMQEPQLIAWYQAGQARIDALTLQEYLDELAALVLEKNWAHKIRDTIISCKQGAWPFIDWKIELENLNALLTTSSPAHALTADGLKVQLEANLNTELKLIILNEPVLSTKLDTWTLEVKERDDRIQAEDARTQRLIDASAASRATKRSKKKDLASRLTDPPAREHRAPKSEWQYLPKLTNTKKALLAAHLGCSRCRKFYAGHKTSECPLISTNQWPDVATYVMLTVEMALTMPHLTVTLDAFGPNVSEFPVSVSALLDSGCPSTVISGALADQLGLRRHPLPKEEDNLASLSNLPLTCTEYVKLELTSGLGAWKST
ncbi:hypothetical protein H0H81_003736, partial [Sphagnurus paluster]